MALVLKRLYQGYFNVMNDLADPRSEEFLLGSSPLPTLGIIALWYMFVSKWGPKYMENRKPLNLKKSMMVYNAVQILMNLYILYMGWLTKGPINFRCSEVDYSRSYSGMLLLKMTYMYFLLKLFDLIDTVFFVLRKKTTHISFLHVYHHAGMGIVGWIGVRFVGGGHSWFLGWINCIVHTILYSYYLLTAYDSKYSKLLWLKKFITQAQLVQFAFLLFVYSLTLFTPNCNYPKVLVYIFIPQNLFMIALFGNFYFRTYHLEPRRKKQGLEKQMRMQEKTQDPEEKKS